MIDPTSWANKRKAAIEHAKKLREQRKNAIEDPDELTFKPQTNKRPSYLKSQDSLDKLASQVSRDPNDPFEQPLPGNKGAYNIHGGPVPAPPALSPGSDALGKEMKNYPSYQQPPSYASDQPPQQQTSASTPYKSKFLQQYSSNGNLPTDPSLHQEHEEYEPTNALQDPNEAFMNSLRGGAKGDGGGWNDDTTCNGFPDMRKQKASKNISSKRRSAAGSETSPQNENTSTAPARRNRANVLDYNAASQVDDYQPVQQQRSPPPPRLPVGDRPMWNNDTEVNYDSTNPYDAPPRQRSQPHNVRMPSDNEVMQSNSARRSSATRSSGQSPGSVASDSAAIARPNLSLLKQKMKRTESGASMRSIGRSNSSQRLALAREASDNSSVSNFSSLHTRSSGNNNYNDSPFAESEDSPSVISAASIRRNSDRRSAPSQRSQLEQQMQENQNAYNPTMGQPRNRIIKNSVANKYAMEMNSNADDDDDDGHVPQYHHLQASQQQEQVRNQPQGQNYRQGGGQTQFSNRPPPQQAAPPVDRSPRNVGSNSAANIYENAALYDGAAFADDDGGIQNQLQCPDCGRKFNPIPYEKHIKICGKVFQQKRKVFDSTKMRVNHDPELAKLAVQAKKEEQRQAKRVLKTQSSNSAYNENVPIRANKPSNARGAPAEKGSKWKEQSNAFREAMKAARQVSKAIATGGPLPEYVPSAPDPSLVPCPHCNRRFNQKAADRHIPQCQNIKAKPNTLKKGAGGGGGIAGSGSSMAKSKKRGGFM